MSHELEFTASSFLRIATLEARRGRDDPGQRFADVNTVINDLKALHKQRRDESGREPNEAKSRLIYGSFRPKIAELQRLKHQVLERELLKVSERLSAALADDSFSWGLERGPDAGARKTYRVGLEDERYFAMKQLEINLKNAHQLSAPNRNRLVAQLCDALEGKLPRFVLRTDIEAFYDSVPHHLLRETLRNHGGLTTTSFAFVSQLLKEWHSLTGRDVGLPTGVGLSAYLGEVYARQIDKVVAGHPSVHFYGRYVDDIVIVARSQESLDEARSRLDRAFTELGLRVNLAKQQQMMPKPNSGTSFDLGQVDFLGYAISKASGTVVVEMANSAINRYKRRLEASFDSWHHKGRDSGHERLLLNRVRFLTGNTKLVNSKGRAVTGIYFNYPKLTKISRSLKALDVYFGVLLSRHSSTFSPKMRARLARASFELGFLNRTFHRFRQSDLERLVAVWRD